MSTPVNQELSGGTAGGLRRSNACLSALSPSGISLLKPNLTELTLREGTVLWDSKKPSADIYFPVSGLISVVIAMPDGECVEVANVAREAAAGASFDPDQSEFFTRGVVQMGGSFIRIPTSQLVFAATQDHEISDLIAASRDWMLMQAQQMSACNAVHSADKRFCRWLYQAAQRMDVDNLYLTQESIAAVLGIRRTTVTLIAQAMQMDGLIHYRRGKISISDMSRLRSVACDCCNSLDRRHWPSTRLLARQRLSSK
jgi:CRP-like cAMP-binding protein